MSRFNSLRAVTHRLNNTPVKELPHIAYFLASSIQNCGDALKTTSGQSSGKNDDLSLQVHKLKAKITSLLQDRSAEGRCTAVILIKATVEAGGREILASSEPWVRGLLTLLSKPDPVSSKRLSLLTITRIFSLTQLYPTLIREITTPLLPTFITTCMNLGSLHPSQRDESQGVRPSPHLETVLHCVLQLIPDHPSTFRPFASKLHATLVNFIGGQSTPDHLTHLAQSVFVALHFCAPKNTAGDEWLNTCQRVIASIHGIASQILRAVIENWEPLESSQHHASVRKVFDGVPHSMENDPLGLPPWEGIYHGSKVLVSLVHLLKTFLLQETSQSVDLPLGPILDLTSRLLYIRVPTNSRESQTSVRFNPEVGREEQEELLAVLPQIHQSTVDLLCSLVEATGLSILPACYTIVDQCLWAFAPDSSNESIRFASYNLLGNLMPLIGPSIARDSFKPLSGIIDACCRDVGPKSHVGEMPNQSRIGSHTKPSLNGHADSFVQQSSKKTVPWQLQVSALETAASRLLCRILEYVPAQAISHAQRALIDRTAILNDQKQVLLASVMNPAPRTTSKYATPSIIPFLARTSHGNLEIEGLLRPRMPVIGNTETSPYDHEAESDQTNEEEYCKYSAAAERSKIAQQPPDENVGTELLPKDPKSTDRQSTKIREQPRPGPAENQNHILDRVENSIEDGADVASEAETSHILTTDQALVKPSWDQSNLTLHEQPFHQGGKRNFDTADVHKAEGSRKRLRSGDRDLEPTHVALPEETAAGASAAASSIIDPDAVVTGGKGVGDAVVDKGKGRAMSVSPRPGVIDASLKEKLQEKKEEEEEEDNDESGSDIPPLYLKTSSEEEDEDEEMM